MKISAEIKGRDNYRPYKDPKEARDKNYLPEPEGEEKPYVLKVKNDAPYKDVYVMSLSFHKVLKNKNGSSDLVQIRYLADNQLEAIKEVAANKKYTDKTVKPHRKVSALDMIEIEELPQGDYDELMSLEGLLKVRQVKKLQSPDEIKAEMKRLEKLLEDVEEAGEAQEKAEEKAKEESEKDEEEDEKKKKRRKRSTRSKKK